MSFYLGSNQFKVYIGTQPYIVRVETAIPDIDPDEPIIEPQRYSLKIYWRAGIQDVTVTRTSTQHSTAPLGRLYSGSPIYAGDTLDISAIATPSDYEIKPYQPQIIVTGDTTVYVETTDTITSIRQAQEIYLPSGDIIEVVPDQGYEYVDVTADFNMDMIWTSLHWGNLQWDFNCLTEETPIDIYKLSDDDANWFYDLQSELIDQFGEADITSQQQVQYLKTHGTYLGSLWVDYGHIQDGCWYIAYKHNKQKNAIEELVLNDNYSIAVTMCAAHDEYDFDYFEFNADFPAKLLCRGCNWGYLKIDISYPTIDNPIDVYEFDTYDNIEYQEIQGVPEAEAEYIAQHGTYLGSIYLDDNNQWQIIYKENL